MRNLVKCSEAIEQELEISEIITANYFKKENNITKTEDALMKLASAGDCDGTFKLQFRSLFLILVFLKNL